MSHILETVDKIYAAFGTGDIPAILGVMDEEVQWELWENNTAQKAGVPWMIPGTGKKTVMEFFKAAAGLQVKDFRVLSIMANDTQVAVEFVFEADVLSTGKHYRDEEIHLWTFNGDGKVIRFRHYLDTAKHIEAAKS